MITVALALSLVIAALGWTRERALRQGDRARLRHAGIELELSGAREAQLVENAKLGAQAALVSMIMLRDTFVIDDVDDVAEPHPEDDPGATRH